MDGETRGLGWLALGSLVTVGLVAMFLAPSIADTRAPDKGQIRAYLVSKLSDEQLMKLHNNSVREFEEHKKLQAEEGKKYWAERAKRQQACEANPAAKLRDPHGCSEPLPITFEDIGKPLMGWENPEKVFEHNLIGLCATVRSIREARQAGCLP